jgi:hypothetical protein
VGYSGRIEAMPAILIPYSRGFGRERVWVHIRAVLLFLLIIPGIRAADPLTILPQIPGPAGIPLKLSNREVFTFRSTLGPYHPSQRAAAAAALIENCRANPGIPRVSSALAGTNAEIRVYGQAVFFVTPGDVYDI